jgi:hypothetical protein
MGTSSYIIFIKKPEFVPFVGKFSTYTSYSSPLALHFYWGETLHVPWFNQYVRIKQNI